MTDAQQAHGQSGLAAFPGLQLLGEDTAMGACVDGVCAMPGTPTADPADEKTD